MTMSFELDGTRLLVVGASAGIGRATATMAAEAGASVAVASRRGAPLESLDAVAIIGDVTYEADASRIVGEAVAALGGLDALVYAVGISPLVPMGAASAQDWHDVLAANVVGAAMVASAAAPHLLESNGRAILLSSKSVRRPFPDLGLYSTSKIALDGLIRSLPVEFPGLLVTRVVVGNTAGTEFADRWDPEKMTEAIAKWDEAGVLGGGMMHVDDVAESILCAVASSGHIDDIAVIDTAEDDGG